ncbi:hypothetical protein J2J97_31970 (plasmid) [Rhizobium bangladeshense]|uniref:hypothetical protein n=1 Tax=Rhizobium bangladeshense TaxID=1138189 RepID=UPI001A98B734|nr:hypothetical protein [Rhizobium bangladeshense]QSY98690.1 hypothetical protein J2J97_31970 [Rhizobium bangladeshense]
MQRGAAAHNRAPFQEREIAKRVGGNVTKASGAQGEKGDARVRGVVRIEAKTTSNKSFSVTREIIEKIEAAALGAGEVPYLEIELLGQDGKPTHRVAVLPVWGIDMLLGQQ